MCIVLIVSSILQTCIYIDLRDLWIVVIGKSTSTKESCFLLSKLKSTKEVLHSLAFFMGLVEGKLFQTRLRLYAKKFIYFKHIYFLKVNF